MLLVSGKELARRRLSRASDPCHSARTTNTFQCVSSIWRISKTTSTWSPTSSCSGLAQPNAEPEMVDDSSAKKRKRSSSDAARVEEAAASASDAEPEKKKRRSDKKEKKDGKKSRKEKKSKKSKKSKKD